MKKPTQTNSNFNLKESVRLCVPWFSREELQHVYSTVFHSDPKVLREGYKYLLVWKSRRSFMPPGVEATFYFCEVILQDGKSQDSSDELFLPQLRLTYATTVMRFLNLVLDPGPGKTERKTLFHLADSVGIPRWIVDIRHDSAHGSILPDIEVLRSAARFCMNWLKERYWEEAVKMTDLIINEGDVILSDDEQLVKQVFDCWENFAIFKLANLSRKKKVEPKLWAQVNDIAASLKSRKIDSAQRVTDTDGALLVLHQKVREILRNRRNHSMKSSFVKRMLSIDSFLPSENILALFKAKSANKDFPDALVVTWAEIMKNIWENGCVSFLLEQLVNIAKNSNETSLRRKFAGLWLRQILLSLVKTKESKKVLEAAVAHERLSGFSEQILRSAISNAVVVQRPELRGAYSWSCLPLPRCVLSTDLIEKCLTNPQVSNVHDLLPSLLELLDPPLPSDMGDALKDSLAICAERSKSLKRPSSDTIYTLNDVLQTDTDLSKVPETSSKLSSIPATSKGPWKRSSDIFGWSRAALGILPWQCDNATNVWRDLEIKNT